MTGLKKQTAKDRKLRQKTLGRKIWTCFVLLVLAVVYSATSVVYSTHKSRHLLNELQQLGKQRNDLQVEWGQLLLEQSSLISQGRIEDIAIADLGMEIPAMENVVVVASD